MMNKSKSKNALFNEALKLFKSNPADSIRLIRQNQLFLIDEKWGEFSELAKNSEDLDIIKRIREFEQIRLIRDASEKGKNTILNSLNEFEFIELLCLIAIFWEKRRLEVVVIQGGNFNSYDALIADACGQILQQRLKGQVEFPQHSDPDLFQIQFLEVLVRCQDSEYLKKFEDIFEVYKYDFYYRDLLSRFCFQNHQLIFLDEHSFKVVPPDRESEIRWDRIGEQYKRMTVYYQNLAEAISENNQSQGKTLGNVFSESEILFELLYWDDLGFPEEVEIDGHKVAPLNTLRFMNALDGNQLDRYLAHIIKLFENQKDIISDPMKIIALAIEKMVIQKGIFIGPLNFRTETEFLKQTKGVFKNDPDFLAEEIPPAFDLLSFKLDDPEVSKQSINLFERPFLRFGNMVCWLVGTVANKNHAVVIQNRLLKYWDKKKQSREINKKSSGLVSKIANTFEDVGFMTKKGVDLRDPNSNRTVTDVDVFAWKGDTVFVIQVKDTYARSEPKSIVEYWEKIEEGGNQLDKSMDFVSLYREKVLSKLGISPTDDKIQFYVSAQATASCRQA
ncbi:MAG: hypothetical protein SF052_20550 [Bacteroidia bacterium]|nr:hypothetical protein [Bacteroidia bacterium]